MAAAETDSDKAAAKLQAFGITPQAAINDLDGSLEKVFKRIVEAKPGVEQITLAQKAFGKSGADLIPVLDSFDGDLAGRSKDRPEIETDELRVARRRVLERRLWNDAGRPGWRPACGPPAHAHDPRRARHTQQQEGQRTRGVDRVDPHDR